MAVILAGGVSDTGRVRQVNEDMVRLAEPNSPEVQASGFLTVVADGMGGHQHGEVASQLAVEALFETFYAHTSRDGVDAALKRGFRVANERIIAASASMGAGGGADGGSMGTTLVATAIVGDALTVANVGDSRAYLLRAESATQITRDHSLVAEQVASGVITPEEARDSHQRNIITRALGHRPKLDVDIFEIALLPDDRVILCSDGVHGHVELEEFAELGARGEPEAASRALIELALERGSTDNVSAAVIWYEPSLAATTAGEAGREPVGAGRGGLSPVLLLLLLVVVIAIVAGVAFVFFAP